MAKPSCLRGSAAACSRPVAQHTDWPPKENGRKQMMWTSSRVAQWLAFWAHKPKVSGAKPGSAIALHATCSVQTRDGVFVWAMPFRTARHFQRQPTLSRRWGSYHLGYEMWIARGVAHCLAWILGNWQGARSVTVSYKPPMLVTRVRLPACAVSIC